MKTLLVAFALISFNAFADHHEEMKGKTFEEKKAMMTQKIDERISKMNEMKSCISAASDEAGLKTCHAKMKEMRKEMKKKWKAHKSERKNKK